MKRLCLFGVLACALMAAPAGASTFIAMSDVELVSGSDAVVVGEVLYTYSYWNPEGTLIFTDAVVHVQESVVGGASGLVAVRTAGGQIGDFGVEAHGFPSFEKGQRHLLYLQRTPEGTLSVTGFQQGQYRVVRRSDGTDVAIPALRGVRLLRPDGREAPAPRAVPLEQLKQTIRAQAASLNRQPRVK